MLAPGSRPWTLALLAVLAGTTIGCFLPYRPGCRMGAQQPGKDPFLTVLLVTESPGSAQVGIDRDGQSFFAGNATNWLFAPTYTCQGLPAQDLHAMRAAWERVPREAQAAGAEPERPYLFIAHYTTTQRKAVFHLRPDEIGRHPALDRAAGLTLTILRRIYGDRFHRELRAAGLEMFLEPIASCCWPHAAAGVADRAPPRR